MEGQLRQTSHLNIPLLKSAAGQRTFYYRAVKLWNDLCPELKASKKIREFKYKLKRMLLDSFFIIRMQYLIYSRF